MTGRAAAVGLLGFTDPSANQNGDALKMTALFAEGAVAFLPTTLPTSIEHAGDTNEAVTDFALFQNYPNPFNPHSTISFAIPAPEFVTLTVYNLLGQPITSLVDNTLSAGRYTVGLDASTLPSGVYVYVLEAGAFRETRKMIVSK